MKNEELLIAGETFRLYVKRFAELTLEELYALTKLRQEVFVVEQACAFLDSDGFDQQALHVMIFNSDAQLVAYGRILDKQIIYEQATIGRVVSAIAYRKKGLGRILFAKCLELLVEYYGAQKIKIQAQSYLVDFYGSFGFNIINEAYLDTGIYHNDMMRDA